MISNEQIDRALAEMSVAAREAIERARQAERALEDYSYPRTAYASRQYDPVKRDKLFDAFQEADYFAESRSFISELIRRSQIKHGVPHDAVCFFKDGDRWCCVHGDFVSLQESPAGFGETFESALENLRAFRDIQNAAR